MDSLDYAPFPAMTEEDIAELLGDIDLVEILPTPNIVDNFDIIEGKYPRRDSPDLMEFLSYMNCQDRKTSRSVLAFVFANQMPDEKSRQAMDFLIETFCFKHVDEHGYHIIILRDDVEISETVLDIPPCPHYCHVDTVEPEPFATPGIDDLWATTRFNLDPVLPVRKIRNPGKVITRDRGTDWTPLPHVMLTLEMGCFTRALEDLRLPIDQHTAILEDFRAVTMTTKQRAKNRMRRGQDPMNAKRCEKFITRYEHPNFSADSIAEVLSQMGRSSVPGAEYVEQRAHCFWCIAAMHGVPSSVWPNAYQFKRISSKV
jgi:hypothetical protein